MNDILIYLIILLTLTNLASITLYYRLLKIKKSKAPGSSAELSEFLADLVNGEGLVRISRVAPNDVFLRSPRHGRP